MCIEQGVKHQKTGGETSELNDWIEKISQINKNSEDYLILVKYLSRSQQIIKILLIELIKIYVLPAFLQ